MRILDLDTIRSLVDVPDLLRDIEEGYAFYSEGKVEVPPVGFLHLPDPPGDVHIKYGYIRGDDVYVIKVASGFLDPALGSTTSDGLLLVFDQRTGRPECILLDECWLTDVRTAVGGAVAARHLAPARVTGIGIVGTGVQARMQLEFLQHVIDCDRAVVWGRNPDRVERLVTGIAEGEAFWSRALEVRGTTDLDDLASSCNLIVTATSARSPLIRADQVAPGTHITAMGSDDVGKQELDVGVLAKAHRVVADSRSQCAHHGEVAHAVRQGLVAEADVVELGQVIRDPGLGRTAEDQITVADLTGVAVQDIQIAKMVSRRARLSTG